LRGTIYRLRALGKSSKWTAPDGISEFNDARICPADRNTTRDAALSPSPHAGSN
jgi:hypothetical protein